MPRLTTRDYKRPSRSSSAAKLKEFGLGVLVGAVLASAAFLIGGARARHEAAAAAPSPPRAGAGSPGAAPQAPPAGGSSSNRSDATPAPGSAAPSAAAAQTPHYDFYRMLPSFEVPVPHDDERVSQPPPAAALPAATATAGPAYVLQVGSYHSTAEADQVRARLARMGITAQVQRMVDGSRTWNRVRVGPLGEAELQRVREQLRTANLHPLVIRADR